MEPTAAVTPEELASFTRQLGAMLDVGVNVLRALRIASHHTGSALLIQASEEVARALEDGRELNEALSRRPDLFGPFYIEMTRQGEADGTLGQALLSVADYLDRLPSDAALAPAPPEPVVAPEGVAPSLLTALGVTALGAGALWAFSAAMPALLPPHWLTPLALLWAGASMVFAGKRLPRQGTPATLATPPPPSLPPKSSERKAAETAGILRVALQEQEEALQQGEAGREERRDTDETPTAPVERPASRFEL